MLVVARKCGERVCFTTRDGESPVLPITVQVVRIGPGVVRLGIEAPDGVLVLREELTPHDAEEASA